jgi:hypothetical protein
MRAKKRTFIERTPAMTLHCHIVRPAARVRPAMKALKKGEA